MGEEKKRNTVNLVSNKTDPLGHGKVDHDDVALDESEVKIRQELVAEGRGHTLHCLLHSLSRLAILNKSGFDCI